MGIANWWFSHRLSGVLPTERRHYGRRANDRFVDLADAVSAGMGTPLNIVAWALLIAVWTGAFILNPHLQDTQFLPAWFVSNAYNFPLNTVTTLAELFIGFLIAAAANRVERRNRQLHEKMATMLETVEALDEDEDAAILRLEEKVDHLIAALTVDKH